LTRPEHFVRFAGEEARVQLLAPVNGRKRYTGVIAGSSDEAVTLTTELGDVVLPYATIERARLIPDFDKGKP